MQGLYASLIVCAVVGLAVLIGYCASVYEIKLALRRSEAMQAWAAGYGFQILDRPHDRPAPFRRAITGVSKDKIAPLRPIALFQQGWPHNFMEGQVEGRLVWVFEHYYVISSGKSSRRIDHTIVAVGLRRETPQFDLRPHTFWDKVRSLFGHRDIEIGDSEFDRKFFISSTDEAFIRRLLDPSMREAMGSESWHCVNGFVVRIGDGQYTEEELSKALADTLFLANRLDNV